MEDAPDWDDLLLEDALHQEEDEPMMDEEDYPAFDEDEYEDPVMVQPSLKMPSSTSNVPSSKRAATEEPDMYEDDDDDDDGDPPIGSPPPPSPPSPTTPRAEGYSPTTRSNEQRRGERQVRPSARKDVFAFER
jgi:hypothetical protein